MVFPCGQVPVPDDELLFKAPMITKMGRRVRSKPSAKKGPRVKSKFAPIYPSWSLRRKEMELEVICPPGLSEGNTLLVRTPFDARRIPVALPKGLKSGDLFVVSIPAADEETREPELPYWSLIVDNFFTPTPEVMGRPLWSC